MIPVVSVIMHVISLANRECAYTITLAINMTTDSNDIYLFSLGACFIRLASNHTTLLIVINKTIEFLAVCMKWWTPNT